MTAYTPSPCTRISKHFAFNGTCLPPRADPWIGGYSVASPLQHFPFGHVIGRSPPPSAIRTFGSTRMVAGMPVSWSGADDKRGMPDGSASVPPTVKTDAAIRLIPTHRRITCVICSPLWKSREMLITETCVPLPCKVRGHPGSNPVSVKEIGAIHQSLRPGALRGRGARHWPSPLARPLFPPRCHPPPRQQESPLISKR